MFGNKGISSAVIAVIVIVIIVVVGVGGYLAMTDNGDEGPADNEGPPISMTWEMEDTQFLPQTIEVDVGDTVRIVNNDSITHTFDAQNPDTGEVVINETIVGGESITLHLDMRGFAVSTGSACFSKSLEASHVITGIGGDHERAHGSVRFTFGRYNEMAEVEKTVNAVSEVVEKLREISPLGKEE